MTTLAEQVAAIPGRTSPDNSGQFLDADAGRAAMARIVEETQGATIAANALAPGSVEQTVAGALTALWRRPGGGLPGPLLAQIGDSRHAGGILSNSPSFGRQMQSAGAWIEFLTFGRVRSPTTYNMAVGGTGPSDLDGQITNVLVLSPLPTHCAILTGTNAINNATTAAGLMSGMQDSFRAAWSRLLAAGIVPVTCLDLPRQWTDTTLTAAVKRGLHNELNNWLRAAAPLYRSLLIDPVWQLTDQTNVNGECLGSLYQVESPYIHPGPTGGYLVGNAYKTLFESMGLPPRYVGLGQGDKYDATNNPRGNLLPEGGLFLSSGGGLTGSPAPTGVAPLGWNLRNDLNFADLTAVGSLEARTDGPGNWFKVVASSTGQPAIVLVYNQATYNLAIGDTVQFAIDVMMDASSSIDQCAVYLDDRTASGASVNRGEYAMQFGSLPTVGAMPATFAGRAITNPLTLSSGWVTLRHSVAVQLKTGGSVTFRVGAAELRKVPATI